MLAKRKGKLDFLFSLLAKFEFESMINHQSLISSVLILRLEYSFLTRNVVNDRKASLV